MAVDVAVLEAPVIITDDTPYEDTILGSSVLLADNFSIRPLATLSPDVDFTIVSTMDESRFIS